MPDFSVDLTTTRFSDVIVPTVDTVRAAYVIELLVTHKKQVRDRAIGFCNVKEQTDIYERKYGRIDRRRGGETDGRWKEGEQT